METGLWRCSRCKQKIENLQKPTECPDCGRYYNKPRIRYKPSGRGTNRKYFGKEYNRIRSVKFTKVGGKTNYYG